MLPLSTEFKDKVVELCKQFTSLTDDEIEELLKVISYWETEAVAPDADVFVDVFNEIKKNALVVYHRMPLSKPSMYDHAVVGLDALMENEPGVLRTMQLGINSIGLIALSQEGKLIRQSIYPIKYGGKVIGTLIIETDGSIPSDENETSIEAIIDTNYITDDFIINQLSENVLVFDAKGILLSANAGAKELYRRLGYRNNIIGMSYDNLTLDYVTFDYIKFKIERESGNWSIDSESKYLHYYFVIKHSWIALRERLVVVVQDVTEFKRREEELVLKSVAIQEMHHRVKNNLQSIVSLLKIQGRRAKHGETKKVLQDSVSRIMAIASTHELLSKQMENYTLLEQTLTMVVHNFHHIFANYKDVKICLQVDSEVYITTDQVVAVSVIVNELLQNVFDHAYNDRQGGNVTVVGKLVNSTIFIEVSDDGSGFDISAVNDDSLGMMIIKGYVKDKLKGKLKIESDGNGTRVSFCFRYDVTM